MRWLLLPAIALAIGCREKRPIEVGAIDFDYGFLVIYPEDGPPIRVSDTFGVEDGRVVFGEQPALVLEENEERFLFVGLDADQLHPSFERARAPELRAILEPPPEGLLVDGAGPDITAKTRLPDGASLYTAELAEAGDSLRRAEPSEFELFERITLSIPVEPEHCRIVGQTPLTPFGGRPNPGAGLRNIESVHYLDRDRALVATLTHVYAIERGGSLTSTTSGPVWSIFEDPEFRLGEGILDLAMGPIEPDGSRRLVAVGGDLINEEATYGRIWPLRWTEDAIEPDGPSIVLAGDRFRAAEVTPDGKAWVGGGSGLLLSRAPGGADFTMETELPHRTDLYDTIYDLSAIDAGGYRMIAGLKNHLHLLGESGWSSQYLMRGGILGFEPFRFGAFAAITDEDGADYWAAGDRGQIARKRGGGDWELLSETMRDLRYPPRFAPCLSPGDRGELLLFAKVIHAMEAFEGYVHMAHENCNALVVVRRSDQCVSLVLPEGQEEVAFSTTYITAMDRLERRILVGLYLGELYETVLP